MNETELEILLEKIIKRNAEKVILEQEILNINRINAESKRIIELFWSDKICSYDQLLVDEKLRLQQLNNTYIAIGFVVIMFLFLIFRLYNIFKGRKYNPIKCVSIFVAYLFNYIAKITDLYDYFVVLLLPIICIFLIIFIYIIILVFNIISCNIGYYALNLYQDYTKISYIQPNMSIYIIILTLTHLLHP